MDGDDDTQLSPEQVRTYVGQAAVNLHAATTLGGTPIQTGLEQDSLAAKACSGGEILVYNTTTSAWDCGQDQNDTLTAAEVKNLVENASALNLSSGAQMAGSPLVTESSLTWNQVQGRPAGLDDGDDDAANDRRYFEPYVILERELIGSIVVPFCPESELSGIGAPWADPTALRDMVVWANEQYMRIAVDTGTDMIFMLEEFCGHGHANDDPMAPWSETSWTSSGAPTRR